MNAWLTRIVLSPLSREVRSDLRSAEMLHKRVMSLLPDGIGASARASAGVLYRYDETQTTGPHLLVQSWLPTDPAKLPKGYGAVETRDLAPLLDALCTGLAMRYRISANTAKRLGRTSERAGKLVALRGPEAEAWWHARAESSGLLLRTLVSTSQADIRGRGKDTICHAVARFEGVAVIREPDSVRQAVLNGVGRGKAYGCGLLSLAPLR